MKHRSLNMFMMFSLLLVSAFFIGTIASPRPTDAALPAAQEHHDAMADMRHAEAMLRDARGLLAAAPGEFGGHRDKAIKKIDEALGEVHEAMAHH